MRADFSETDRCLSGVYCRRCRDLEHGRGWRTRIATRFAIPGGDVDWPCPHGKPWGFQDGPPPRLRGMVGSPPAAVALPAGPPPTVTDPPYVAQRRAACAACDVPESACAVKARRTIKPCWFGAYIARPGAVCLANPPRWPR